MENSVLLASQTHLLQARRTREEGGLSWPERETNLGTDSD